MNAHSEPFAQFNDTMQTIARETFRPIREYAKLVRHGYGTVNGRFVDNRPLAERYPMAVQIKGPRRHEPGSIR